MAFVRSIGRLFVAPYFFSTAQEQEWERSLDSQYEMSIPGMNMSKDMKPRLDSHDGVPQLWATSPFVRAALVVTYAEWRAMGNQNVGVGRNRRVKAGALIWLCVAVGSIVASDRTAPNVEATDSDPVIDEQVAIRDQGAQARVLVEFTVMVAGDYNLVAVGEFVEPIVEVSNLRNLVPKGEIARVYQQVAVWKSQVAVQFVRIGDANNSDAVLT
jgi:hypothetical protein